jgi:hypothetical protein
MIVRFSCVVVNLMACHEELVSGGAFSVSKGLYPYIRGKIDQHL